MAKLIVQHEVDPGIGMALEEVPPNTPGRARGTHGSCTECGWTIHRWKRDKAIEDAQKHVDRHESQI